MNKQTLNKINSFLSIIGITGLLLYGYFKFHTTQSEKALILYSDDALKTTCPNSPQPTRYQECFRSQIGKILGEATPTDLISIIETINDLKEKDLFLSDSDEEKFLAELFYFENWSIVLDYSKTVNLKRDSITFLDIFFIPVVKKKMAQDFFELQESFEIFKNRMPPSISDAYKTRVNLVNKKLGKTKK